MNAANNLYGLTRDVIDKIKGAFAHFNAIDSVILYGSRAKGNYRTRSDIDLTLKTNSRATKRLLLDVIGVIDKLNLIYLFDISLFSDITNKNLINHINRVGIEFYQRDIFLSQNAQR